MRSARFLGVASAFAAGIGGAQAQTTALPQITVNAPSPIQRAAPPQDGIPLLEGTLPIVTDQFATVTVMQAPDIQRSSGITLGEVLQAKPGITSSGFAPGAASRPVIRGLDNYRVRIQENGLNVNDMSDLSDDHAVPVDPMSAQQVEVIRGPATLRYGSQAIGGVVNVDNNRIPTAIPRGGFAGQMKGSLNSGDMGAEGAAQIDAGQGNFAFHADAFARNAQDYRIPSYPYLYAPAPQPYVGNKQPNSAARADGQSVGGSYIFNGGFVGAAVTRFASFYRVPGMEAAEHDARIDLEQTKFTSKGEFRPGSSAVDTVRFWASATDYKHHELANEGGFDGVQQTFTNRSEEGRVETTLTPFNLRFATLTTAFGVQAARNKIAAIATEGGGLLDPAETRSVAGYVFNEFRFSDTLRAQVAGRIEHLTVDGTATNFPADFLPVFGPGPVFIPPTTSPLTRNFTPVSVSAGVLQDLPYNLVGSVTAQYVERAPRAPELLSKGVHEASGTFEIGNPNLTIESASSLEVGLRRAAGPWRFELTGFYTSYSNFIFRRFTGVLCDEDFESCGTGTELQQVVYSQQNATFRGAEFQSQFDLVPVAGGMFGIDAQYDIVRATFSDGTNVPRLPPQRYGGGMFWRDPHWFVRVGLLHADAQNNLAPNETPTAGYNLLKAVVSHTHAVRNSPFGATELTVGVVGDNLLDDDVRNSVSFKKDEVLQPGRTVKVFASARF
jgi:iron complex outermembrane receptor protein